jgi:serine/threonine-protein kinase
MLTLLGGAVLAGGLLVANILVTGDDPAGDPVAAGGTPTTPAEPTATPTPEPAEVPEPTEPVTYVGYVDGGGASVALVLDGEDATGYVCDGEIEAWLTGPTGSGELALRGDGGELTAKFDESSATGEVTAGGQTWTFAIAQVDPPEGLYRVADTILGGAEVDGGWIVLPDGTQIGVLTLDGQSQPAPRLDPATGAVTIDGRPVTADRVGD